METEHNEHEIITEKLDNILKILNGNGRIGLVAKVDILWGAGAVIMLVSITALVRAFWGTIGV